MPELVAELITTIDGLAKGKRSPGFYGYDGPQFMKWMAEEQARPHRNLLGKKTLKLLSSLPDEAKDDDYLKMAANPGWVFSTKLKKTDWPGLEIIPNGLPKRVRDWKKDDGPEIRTMGSLSIVRQLVGAGLVDRFRLMMCPLILPETGAEPVFKSYPDMEFELLSSKVLDGRVLILEYRPGGKPPKS